ncbi:hypothetical protein BLGI_906 [Brevibacillus laterosporus GI-9]|nr:hypothetical protein BLGI_906 [Brevibacillus laterosporus GI-9]
MAKAERFSVCFIAKFTLSSPLPAQIIQLITIINIDHSELAIAVP